LRLLILTKNIWNFSLSTNCCFISNLAF